MIKSAIVCRSRLAGDGGRKSDAIFDGLIASKPAPTSDVGRTVNT
jgi:hypothetical protein